MSETYPKPLANFNQSGVEDPVCNMSEYWFLAQLCLKDQKIVKGTFLNQISEISDQAKAIKKIYLDYKLF